MAAPGETDLGAMLASLGVERRDGTYTFVALDDPSAELRSLASAVVEEAEATTLVVEVGAARAAGLDVVVELAWLTLTVTSSLEAVGLTAAVSERLARAGIACNVLAGFHHDHLLVPATRADDAVTALLTP